MHRGSLGTQRRGEWRSVRSCSWGFGGNGSNDEEDGERAEKLVEETRNLGELAEGIFWGWDPIQDSEEYAEWLEE